MKFDPETEKMSINLKEWEPPKDFIIMKAIVFPQINIVWVGSILMILGFAISLWQRIKTSKS